MSDSSRQIFQTASPSRWRRFQWSFRVLMLLLVLCGVVVIYTVYRVYDPSLPALRDRNAHYQKILKPDASALAFDNAINRRYAGFRKFIETQYQPGERFNHVKKAAGVSAGQPCPVRAGFYVNWDAQSMASLRANLPRLNTVLPEWFFLAPSGDSIIDQTDGAALYMLQHSGVKTLPMLTNYTDTAFYGASVQKMLHDPARAAKLTEQLVALIRKYHFAGVNLDFEELNSESDAPLLRFMQQLHQRFQAEGLLLTQDVAPFNDDYNLKALAGCTDYLYLMAYDQHNSTSAPGPIANQHWIEGAVADAQHDVPAGKLILCVAGYGYDWPQGGTATDISYAEAITTARESEGKVRFDNDNYNLSYTYSDDADQPHTVWFTDAATTFNTLRFATESGLGGVALWRLGGEDPRVWSFFAKDLSGGGWRKINKAALETVPGTNDVDYEGEGDILDVVATPQRGRLRLAIDTTTGLISGETYAQLPSSYDIRKYGQSPKKIVLSFDDGPDPTYTPRILDILSREHVPAAFFLVGINAENNIPLVKRLYREGHEIGSHTFTHPNMAEVSPGRALLELNATRLLLECITGHSTILFRPPYNADAEPRTLQELAPVAYARQHNYLTVGESIDPNDWQIGVSADSIFKRVVDQQSLGNIVLLHDAGGNREATIQALPRIIKYFKNKGYTFTTVAGLTGLSRETLMPAVPHRAGYYLIQLNYGLASLGYWGSRFLFSLFLLCICISIIRLLVLGLLALRQKRRETAPVVQSPAWPRVSILIPAYNEEVTAVDSVKRLLQQDYPHFDIVFVDDGSHDQTYKRVLDAFSGNDCVRVFTKPNGGKASALNYALAQTDAPIVLCMDADTVLQPDALRLLVPHFESGAVGAVAGNVKVGNRVNLLTRWQHIEYLTSQAYDRRAYAVLNAITVVPGAIGAFRSEAIRKVGGLATDTLAEDCDLTLRLLRAGYRIVNEPRATALTEAPETLRMFLRQRFRWTFGVMQAFWKHRDLLFRRGSGAIGWVALPNILIFQLLIPLLSPLADFFMLIGLLTGGGAMILKYYLIFMAVDTLVALLAFRFERASPSVLIWLIPQRLAYRWLMLWVLFKAMRRAIRGELQSWGLLKRTGRVTATV